MVQLSPYRSVVEFPKKLLNWWNFPTRRTFIRAKLENSKEKYCHVEKARSINNKHKL
jgi:hypothetical protein